MTRGASRRRFLANGLALAALPALGAGCSAPLELPAPRPVPWKMKSLDSAKTSLEFLPDGRLFLRIRHDVLRGVSPRMLAWWFANLEGDLEVGGKTWPRYLIWHPVDHISIRYARRRADGTIGPGAQIHIREALGARPDYLVDVVTTIEKLDESGFVHARKALGLDLVRLEYTFTPVKGGTLYENTLTAGPQGAAASAVFNSVIRPGLFPDAQARAWLKHNVEEVGNFEFFLPALYARFT